MKLPKHLAFRLLRLPSRPSGSYAVAATEASCGLGWGDFCGHAQLGGDGARRCSLFDAPLELRGALANDAHLVKTRETIDAAGATTLDELLKINPNAGAVLGLGPEVLRCRACLEADAGELGKRRAARMIRGQGDPGPQHCGLVT